MKKRIKSLSLALGLTLIVGFSGGLVEASSELSNSKTEELGIRVDEEKAISYIESLKEKNEDSEVSTFAAAPALSYLEVFAVGSTQYLQKFGGDGYEYVESNQLSTKEDHGGRQFIVVTAELGYSSPSRIAEFKGERLELIDSQWIDTNGDSIIDGYFYYWDASGDDPRLDHGTFDYKAWSQNFPFNQMIDSIYIY